MEPHDNECLKDIEGTVTSINKQLLFFTLDDQYNIYVTMNKSLETLPEVKDKVTILNAHCIANDFSITTYYLCSHSSISITPHVPEPTSPSLPLEQPTTIKEEPSKSTLDLSTDIFPEYLFLSELFTVNFFGLRDLRQIDHSYHTIKRYFGETAFIKSEDVVEWLISKILDTEVIDHSSVSCVNRILPHFQVKTISGDCKYVDSRTKKSESRNLNYWGFGTYYFDSTICSMKNDYIFGHLSINSKYGMVVVGDDINFMPVIMRRDQTSEMSEFIDCLVLIKKYCIITEFYRCSEVKNLQYMLLNPCDLEIVTRNLQKTDQCYSSSSTTGTDTDTDTTAPSNTEIEILSISSIMYNYQKTCEYWIEIEDYIKKEKALLCMSGKSIELKPFLQPGLKYKLFYNPKPPAGENNRILSKLLPYRQYEMNELSQFVPESKAEANSTNQVMDIKTCLDFMKTNGNGNNSLISFQGKIRSKKFYDPLSSRSARKIDESGFGTPGYKTHCLEFHNPAGDNLKLYLNNWESLFIPMGLIPDMIVTVRNVANQKGEYCKSTALTSFEIINYNPSIPFQSVNLSTTHGEVWGKPFPLSMGHKIPIGVLIWCPINSIYIKSLKISVDCSENCQSCDNMKCNSKEFSFNMVLAMNVMDWMGEATLISKSINLLQVLLDYNPDQFASFLDALHEIKTFEYDNQAYLTKNEETDYRNLFRKSFSKMITCLSCIVTDLHFYCRKLSGDDEPENSDPVWYCLKARKGSDNYETY